MTRYYHTPKPSSFFIMDNRCRANLAHIRQSRPDSGIGFQVNSFKLFPLRSEAVPSLKLSGPERLR